MTNPLNGGGPAPFSRELAPGETRTVHEPKSGRTIFITRTSRPYAYDLADAYNAAGRGGDTAWHVDHAGNLRFGLTPNAEQRMRRERSAIALADMSAPGSPADPSRARARAADQPEYV